MNSNRLTRRAALTASSTVVWAQQRPLVPAGRPSFVDVFWEPFERNVLGLLPIKPGMRILDLGCGSGSHLGLLAERLRGKGEVVGFDIRQDRLDLAAMRFRSQQIIRLRQGDIYKLPFDNASFDLVWSSHVFHALTDIDAAARQLRRVLRPQGIAVLREDASSVRFLPLDFGVGKPGLEGRIHQAFMEWFVEDRLKLGRYPHGWTHTLDNAGLRQVRAESILHQARPPFSQDQKDYMAYALRRRSDYPTLSAEDRATVVEITDPASPNYVFNRKDLHFTASSTIYTGVA
jgi:ubiquinone/menaquinone biosynthesis C-methylase UbiE